MLHGRFGEGTGHANNPVSSRHPDRPILVLGGTATLGKHVAQPYPALLAGLLARPVRNLGALNAGPDHYLADPKALEGTAEADLAILQPGGAEGVTNPFYTVHSRRNDRFLGATPALRRLFPEVDFAEVHFTRHLLSVLHQTDPARFAVLARSLQTSWLARMQALLRHLPPRRLLLLLSRPLGDSDPLYPALITQDMLQSLSGTALITVTLPPAAGLPGSGLPDAPEHQLIAGRLAPLVTRLLRAPPPLILHPADRVG